jgi:hypothetical protein
VTVKLGGLGAGKVTVAGSGLRKASRTLTKNQTATIVTKRASHAKATTKIKVTFDPAGPTKAKSYTLSLKKASSAKKAAVRR